MMDDDDDDNDDNDDDDDDAEETIENSHQQTNAAYGNESKPSKIRENSTDVQHNE
jgi:hypothetical protein